MKEKIFSALALLTIFLIMFELNHLMPLHRDDFDYSMVWKTGEHLNSLANVFESTQIHYLEHGGRAFTVFCLNLFLWLGKFTFDVANALMFVALIILIYLHARREIKFDEPKILAAAGILAWLCIPHFGEVAIWKSGSTVYLWSAVPVALFLLPYNFTFAGTKDFGDSNFFAAAMLFLGIIAGCSVENLAVTVTLLSIGLTIYFWQTRNNLQLWMVTGNLGNILGLIILLAAPGNFVRYDVQSIGKGALIHIGNQFAGNGEMLIFLLPLVLLLICAFSKGSKFAKENSGRKIFILIGILILSYFCDNFLARTFKDFFIGNIFPSFNVSEKFIVRFDNFIMKSEEFIIYALILLVIFRRVKSSIKFGGGVKLRNFSYSKFLFGLAIFNNFVMIGAPTFPARATFSSVVMILIGALVILRNSTVHEKIFEGRTGEIVKLGAALLSGFTILSALFITANLRTENDKRVEIVKYAAERKIYFVKFPPLEIKNRAMRHVFFSDFDGTVTKEGLCEFYGIENIRVKDLTKKERGYFERLQAEKIKTNLSDWYKLGIWRKKY
ncbi:MAG: hypothetical protein IJT73_05995 [Selenomonadaceae bacterium]|nr:hypothetical protein [Selenomonadaceae bacterium]